MGSLDLRFGVVINLVSGEENEDQNFKAFIYLNLKPTGSTSSNLKWIKGNSKKFGGKSTSTDNKEVSFPKLESMLTSITSKLDNIKNNCQETALNSAGKTLSDLKKKRALMI